LAIRDRLRAGDRPDCQRPLRPVERAYRCRDDAVPRRLRRRGACLRAPRRTGFGRRGAVEGSGDAGALSRGTLGLSPRAAPDAARGRWAGPAYLFSSFRTIAAPSAIAFSL